MRNVPPAPVLPYAGTSGWSGSATSRERAESDDQSGTTAKRQRLVLAELRSLGPYGATVAEIRATYSWHHGQASSVLSVLHKEHALARLTDRRNRCAIYVAPEFVNGRETAEHASNRVCARPGCIEQRGLANEERRILREALSRLADYDRTAANHEDALANARMVLTLTDRPR